MQNSATAELCATETAKVRRHKLYAVSKKQYQNKDKLRTPRIKRPMICSICRTGLTFMTSPILILKEEKQIVK